MILREILHGKLNFLLCLLTTVVASGIFVALYSANAAAIRSTTAILREMGFNIIIVPKGTPMERYWTQNFPDAEMPEEYARKLAESNVSAEHFVAKLQHRTLLNNEVVVLTGVLPSLGRIGRETRAKKPMGYNVAPGEIFAGSEAAAAAKLQKGGLLTLLGSTFKVSRILPETGSLDDIRLYANLHDVQSLLGKFGKINTIDALGCRCFTKDDFLTQIREEIQALLPDTQVTHIKSIAIAREMTRRRTEQWALYGLGAVIALAACAIASLTYLNVRHRRQEIGLLRTVGVGTAKIAALFLGKVVVYSVLGAALGFAFGLLLARDLGPRLLDSAVEAEWLLLPVCLAAAPAVAIVFGLLPILHGLRLDPAVVLREE